MVLALGRETIDRARVSLEIRKYLLNCWVAYMTGINPCSSYSIIVKLTALNRYPKVKNDAEHVELKYCTYFVYEIRTAVQQ